MNLDKVTRNRLCYSCFLKEEKSITRFSCSEENNDKEQNNNIPKWFKIHLMTYSKVTCMPEGQKTSQI